MKSLCFSAEENIVIACRRQRKYSEQGTLPGEGAATLRSKAAAEDGASNRIRGIPPYEHTVRQKAGHEPSAAVSLRAGQSVSMSGNNAGMQISSRFLLRPTLLYFSCCLPGGASMQELLQLRFFSQPEVPPAHLCSLHEHTRTRCFASIFHVFLLICPDMFFIKDFVRFPEL